MSIIAWFGLGIGAGLGAGFFLRGTWGVLSYVVVGLFGAILGGFMGSAMLGWDVTGLHLGSILLASLGAVLLIGLLHSIPADQPYE